MIPRTFVLALLFKKATYPGDLVRKLDGIYQERVIYKCLGQLEDEGSVVIKPGYADGRRRRIAYLTLKGSQQAVGAMATIKRLFLEE